MHERDIERQDALPKQARHFTEERWDVVSIPSRNGISDICPEKQCIDMKTLRHTRRRAGRFEMAALHPGETREEATVQRFAVARLARDPRRWPGLAVYAFAKAASVVLYRLKALRGRHKEWNRDDSSRASTLG